MTTLITFSGTRGASQPGLQDMPAEILEKISDDLDWVTRARCRLLCKAFEQNMNNDTKDLDEALDFYYNVLHSPEYKDKRTHLGYPQQWAHYHKKRTVYAIMLHKEMRKKNKSYYPSIVPTVFYPRNKTLSREYIHALFDKHFLDMTKNEVGIREIVLGCTDTIIDKFYIHPHSTVERDICVTFYRYFTNNLLTLSFLKELRRLLYNNA